MTIVQHKTIHKSHRSGKQIKYIVIHQTAAKNFESTRTWFHAPESEVSAHYVVDRDGTVHQFVKESLAAWHARGFNSVSIGVEFVGLIEPMTPEQEETFKVMIAYFRSHYPTAEFIEHRELPKTTTKCPTLLFPNHGGLKKFVDKYFIQNVLS